MSTDAGRLRQAAELTRELIDDPDAGQADFERNWSGVFALTFTGGASAGRRSPSGWSAPPPPIRAWDEC